MNEGKKYNNIMSIDDRFWRGVPVAAVVRKLPSYILYSIGRIYIYAMYMSEYYYVFVINERLKKTFPLFPP